MISNEEVQNKVSVSDSILNFDYGVEMRSIRLKKIRDKISEVLE